MKGISVERAKGFGDRLQFTSAPENYFRATGERLVDVDRSWIFDHNPFVIRDAPEPPKTVFSLWNFSPTKYDWPLPVDRPAVYQCNAEVWASVMGVRPTLIRPRLYVFEDFPFEQRRRIYLHTDGRSHGRLPEHVIDHVLRKYKPTGELYLIGQDVPDHKYGLPFVETPTIWDLARVLSEARMLIGCDSGPSWVAACYPDVVIKKVRCRPAVERYDTWLPLEVKNFHSHWDDRMFQIFNSTEQDMGAFQSYKRI